MVGKIKHVRQKIHQEAVKFDRPSSLTQPLDSVLTQSLEKPPASGLHTITLTPPLLENQKSDAPKHVKVCCKNCSNECTLTME